MVKRRSFSRVPVAGFPHRSSAPQAPQRGTRPRGGGEFLIGLLGYSAFHTLRFDRGGTWADTWATFGRYVARDDGIRVIETWCDEPHVARLEPGGTVQRRTSGATGGKTLQ